ncbi:MAG TPA: hypothetical protein VH251_06290 [Verrucomicrobiae bacterium]|jgi:hypothetical protein|nr:hypothetical protein [Verrucomicrobiae bacterium]
MTTLDKSGTSASLKNFPAARDEKPSLIVSRIDVVAVLASLACLCLFGFLAAAMAIVQFAELLSNLWSNSFDRWLILAFAVAVTWVVARWKKLCVF